MTVSSGEPLSIGGQGEEGGEVAHPNSFFPLALATWCGSAFLLIIYYEYGLEISMEYPPPYQGYFYRVYLGVSCAVYYHLFLSFSSAVYVWFQPERINATESQGTVTACIEMVGETDKTVSLAVNLTTGMVIEC